MKKGRIYTNEHGDHGQLTKINEQALLWKLLELCCYCSHIDPSLHRVINFDVIVNDVVLFASRIS